MVSFSNDFVIQSIMSRIWTLEMYVHMFIDDWIYRESKVNQHDGQKKQQTTKSTKRTTKTRLPKENKARNETDQERDGVKQDNGPIVADLLLGQYRSRLMTRPIAIWGATKTQGNPPRNDRIHKIYWEKSTPLNG